MKPAVGMEEMLEAVEESDKMRFGMKYQPDRMISARSNVDEKDDGTGGEANGDGKGKKTGQNLREDGEVEVNGSPAITEEQSQTETQRAIQTFKSGQDTSTSHFYVRANQGHSMKGVEAENLLTPITLEDEANMPVTVVHGTFYGAWESILRDGGLRRMGRNHVHFSTGPPLDEVLRSLNDAESANTRGDAGSAKGRLSTLMDEGKVVSGMRRDAQILLYIDIRKALRDEEGMKWWRSENGVILTEGKGLEGKVGIECWTKVVEVKEGLGMLWELGEDEGGKVVKELPTHLKGKAMPMGKGRGGKQANDKRGERGGRGAKQRPRFDAKGNGS